MYFPGLTTSIRQPSGPFPNPEMGSLDMNKRIFDGGAESFDVRFNQCLAIIIPPLSTAL
ncbi:hypothetical protein M413DRAFT_442276 [Hebeloma cylindrosporum]|uniref:Uncharacterized protein n=1 Tax=Hebeloma cylindrosporum TaxID=76867 RepID=A0A0C2YXE9_HEBCY|nr:hypothetical protein M413DRAFT_442276 [Hebeloma cylindrosporum h7]